MYKIIFIEVLLFFLSFAVSAQINPETKRTNWWYFGQGAGVDWTTGFPVAVTNGQTNSLEGAASISDTEGNLLFYSDGNTIWNKNHLPMQGGFNLLGCNSTTQAIQVSQNALIVPHPGNDSLFYLFHLGCLDFQTYMLKYTVVNIKLNGGLGSVVSPNNLLMKTKAQGLSACRHSDGCSVWVVALDTLNYHNFFKIGQSGINIIPVKQFSKLTSQVPTGYTSCYKFSNDLKMMANITMTGYQYDTLIIHQFNNTTASLSNPIFIFSGDQTIYDVCFSPDNKKLYASSPGSNGGSLVDTLWQFDLTNYNQSAIVNSKTMIYEDSMGIGQMQNGPDGKIYMSRFSTSFIYSNADSLAVINNPNAAGLSCNFNFNAVYLQGKESYASIPNFDHGYFYPSLVNTCLTSIDEVSKGSFKIYPNPFVDDFVIENSSGFEFDLTITDVNGKRIYTESLNGYQNKIIRLNDPPSGVYFLILTKENKTINFKLLKQ